MKESKRKVYFLPYSKKKEVISTEVEPFAVVDTTYGYISFSSSTLRQLGYVNKFIKFYYEPDRKIVGWKFKDRVQQEEMKHWKVVKPNKVGQFRAQIRGILNTFGKGLSSAYKAEIIKYVDKDLLSEHDTYHFIELTKQNSYVKSKRGGRKPTKGLPTSKGEEK